MFDTIAAVSSPHGTGAIAVIRIDGPKSHDIAKKLTGLNKVEYRRVYTTYLNFEGDILDQVNIVFFKSPNSYTGNDLIEIYTHGGILVTQNVLDAILKSGARIAKRGEFTKRGFLNGKISLVQAEAIYQIIEAKSEVSLKMSLQNLKGKLGEEIEYYRGEILNVLSEIEVTFDYPDDIELDEKSILNLLSKLKDEVGRKIEDSKKSIMLNNGIVMTIVGKPNSGKSTLLNRLLLEDRAIVTDIPGTTRDVIKGEIEINGIRFVIVDTAGIRETKDVVEKIGIERSLKEIQKADVILFVLDATTGFTKEDKLILRKIEGGNYIPVWNKCDEGNNFNKIFDGEIKISALNGEGLKNLENKIVSKVKNIIESGTASHVITQRQVEILERVYTHLESAVNNLNMGYEIDLISIDLRRALEELDMLIGRKFSDDLLDNIFSNFCVGK
ncbi:tRNA modification GTPase TrmE [Thermosipho melanesiensis]|uniref:tRNA modification GTPase MnmE n=2 Tax=Thermosipho melanesiensis TaxID=46541 RepID=MNME_THEM4|nr:tRNA uridine-5-carboxymethylaminomethyl(34) synthesis GTPase MnmE [Thermosipho melanesiensis]A6LMN4.1 RecName: Full=tRNA modification GTPase MnmE [Thermosipho melanesiensis BI429]ABR31185.1 tRNA modification GTPase TrmE [Thermosipho melanesiensis BI429]APT74274.1 tRNA modification GTPase TrmE [Thermosipho melanesiensis]OOC36213.1 tRNA modification GTPase TrmE [Thermosipho melanesiensis]OOC37031.1 tRNA modification GTPase TrmE [Thermosipho melanesiensis]OOC37783.1 tRNA modification GTPase T